MTPSSQSFTQDSRTRQRQRQRQQPLLLHIVFLTTGGTIDKDYPHNQSGWAFEFGDEPAIARILTNSYTAFTSNKSWTYTIRSVCQKDSLEITDTDREQMWNAVQEEIHKHRRGHLEQSFPLPLGLGIVVTHGTDTLLETARYLQTQLRHLSSLTVSDDDDRDNQSNINISLAVTGAMRPERFTNSDAPWNVGMSVASVQQQILNNIQQKNLNSQVDSKDVFVCIQGLCLPVDCIQRDTKTGQFYYHHQKEEGEE